MYLVEAQEYAMNLSVERFDFFHVFHDMLNVLLCNSFKKDFIVTPCSFALSIHKRYNRLFRYFDERLVSWNRLCLWLGYICLLYIIYELSGSLI
jgi:hypothetical protein